MESSSRGASSAVMPGAPKPSPGSPATRSPGACPSSAPVPCSPARPRSLLCARPPGQGAALGRSRRRLQRLPSLLHPLLVALERATRTDLVLYQGEPLRTLDVSRSHRVKTVIEVFQLAPNLSCQLLALVLRKRAHAARSIDSTSSACSMLTTLPPAAAAASWARFSSRRSYHSPALSASSPPNGKKI